MFCIGAHDLCKQACPNFVEGIGKGYRSIVLQLQRVTLLVKKQCVTLLPDQGCDLSAR